MSQAGAGQWHYTDQGNQKGPFSVEQMAALLRAGTVRGDTLVWSAGMAGWVPLAQSGLAGPLGVPPASPGAFSPGAGPANPDSFAGAIQVCFARYATFGGRARRPEFWWFMLFGLLGGLATGIVDLLLFGLAAEISPINNLFSLALLIPSLAVGSRRLHDIGRSGWWQLIHLVPLVGQIVLIVFWCQRGTPGPNRFG
jgi:uncharacterized membrane protein YhaH (DUF805 family)